MKKIQQGFSLIEAMVTVLIFSILVAVSYPSYLEYTRRSARADTKSALLENTQYLESNFTTNNCYHRNDSSCGNLVPNITLRVTQTPRTGDAKYMISFQSISPDSYILQSVPTGVQVGDRCGTFTLTQTGQKGITDGIDDTSNCW